MSQKYDLSGPRFGVHFLFAFNPCTTQMHSCLVFWHWQAQFGGNSYRNCRSSKSQAKQHKEWNCLLGGFNIRHAKTAVIAAESRVHRFEDICEFEEVQADHRWCQYRQLGMKDIEDRFILRHMSDIESVHLEVGNKYIFPLFHSSSPISLLKSFISTIIASAFKIYLQFIHLSHQPAMSPCHHSPLLLHYLLTSTL